MLPSEGAVLWLNPSCLSRLASLACTCFFRGLCDEGVLGAPWGHIVAAELLTVQSR